MTKVTAQMSVSLDGCYAGPRHDGSPGDWLHSAEAAGFYEAQSADMAHKARWLRLVAQAVTGRKKAGAVLSEERLRELQDEARRDA